MSGGDRRISEPYQQRKIAKKLGNAAFNTTPRCGSGGSVAASTHKLPPWQRDSRLGHMGANWVWFLGGGVRDSNSMIWTNTFYINRIFTSKKRRYE